ncbi:MAG TPA: PepSY-like domain-containing protein [Gemmatimonadales bacterium]
MRTLIATCSAVLLAAAATATAQETETPVALDQVPKPVTYAVRARFPQGTVRAAAQETEEGKTVYEVSVTERGRNIDVTLTPEGAIVKIEREIAARELPVFVSRALRAKFADATYRFVEAVFTITRGAETLAYYELKLVTGAGKALEVEVAPDGKILKEEEDVETEPDHLSALPDDQCDVLSVQRVVRAVLARL